MASPLGSINVSSLNSIPFDNVYVGNSICFSSVRLTGNTFKKNHYQTRLGL
ncbi:hypothetical protein VHTUMSATKI_14670 [Vibrio harveyi]